MQVGRVVEARRAARERSPGIHGDGRWRRRQALAARSPDTKAAHASGTTSRSREPLIDHASRAEPIGR